MSVKKTFEELMAQRKTLLSGAALVEAEIKARFPALVPRCRYCESEFSHGWHSECCGSC